MRILVTGGAGFIGSHLGDALVERGHELVVVDDLSSGRKANLHPKAKLVELDLRDSRLGEVVASYKPEVLCHYAAQIDVRKSVADPGFDADVNIVATLRLLESCRAAGTASSAP